MKSIEVLQYKTHVHIHVYLVLKDQAMKLDTEVFIYHSTVRLKVQRNALSLLMCV